MQMPPASLQLYFFISLPYSYYLLPAMHHQHCVCCRSSILWTWNQLSTQHPDLFKYIPVCFSSFPIVRILSDDTFSVSSSLLYLFILSYKFEIILILLHLTNQVPNTWISLLFAKYPMNASTTEAVSAMLPGWGYSFLGDPSVLVFLRCKSPLK